MGYKNYDDKWKSTETLVRNLIDVASKNGNFLLNIGPKADGEFPQESIERLKQIGDWMKLNGEAVYGTKGSPLSELSWGRCTQKPLENSTILYLCVFDWPKDGKLIMNDFSNKVISCKLLETNAKLNSTVINNTLEIQIPKIMPNKIATVIKLEVAGNVIRPQTLNQGKKMKTGALD